MRYDWLLLVTLAPIVCAIGYWLGWLLGRKN